MDDDIETIVEEAKEGFDLGAMLKGRPDLNRTNTERFYTDEETGEELGGVETVRDDMGGLQKRRWGILGDIDAKRQERDTLNLILDKREGLGQDDSAAKQFADKLKEVEKEIKALERKVKPLREKLDKSALEIELRYLPPLITKAARREARKAIGVKGRVTEDVYDDYLEELYPQTLSRAAASITQVATGKVNRQVSVEDARDIYNYLPETEQDRLNEFLDKIVFKSKIARHLALDADF